MNSQRQWLLHQSTQESVYGGWPRSGEIDIMEHLNNDNNVYQVIHSHYVDNLGQKTNPVYVATPSFSVSSFNTYGIEWFPDRIVFLVNGNLPTQNRYFCRSVAVAIRSIFLFNSHSGVGRLLGWRNK